jgi:hypothetical protein
MDQDRAGKSREEQDATLDTPLWPRGLQEIKARYGDPGLFRVGSRVRAAWEYHILEAIKLPAPLYYAGRPVHTLTCHHLVKPSLERVLHSVRDAGDVAWDSLSPYGGCYCWRLMRGGGQLSAHCWAIAVDLGVSRNPQGQAWPDFHPAVIAAFRAEGWTHGVDFPCPDPMHFQACSGY